MKSVSKPRVAVYAGTFDPITNGHLDIIRRGLSIVDTLHVAVAESTPKTVMFRTEQRVELVNGAIKALSRSERSRIKVEGFSGLLVDYARSLRAAMILRGLRVVSDYEYEAQMAHINRHLNEDLETVFLVTSEHCSFISSSIVKNIASNGGDISGLVPPNVVKAFSGKPLAK